MTSIKIYSSKRKSIGISILSMLLIVLCFFVAIGSFNNSNLFFQAVGIVGVLFFSLGIYVAISQLIRNKLILTIDSVGINVDPEKSRETIKWENIEGFSTININMTKIIIIHINNPSYWIEGETNKIRKKMMEFNLENYGSPFNISTVTMALSHDKLLDLLNQHLMLHQGEYFN